MALEDSIVLWQSAGDCHHGHVLVPRNSAQLGAKLSSGATTWQLRDYSKHDDVGNPFTESDIVRIGKEKILVGSGNNITRAQGGTVAAAHPDGATVYPDSDGTLIFEHTIVGDDIGKTFTAFKGKGNTRADFEIKINTTWIGPDKTTINEMGFFFPWSGSTPLAENDVIRCYVYNTLPEAEFWFGVIG